jgi:hypothetical protein
VVEKFPVGLKFEEILPEEKGFAFETKKPEFERLGVEVKPVDPLNCALVAAGIEEEKVLVLKLDVNGTCPVEKPCPVEKGFPWLAEVFTPDVPLEKGFPWLAEVFGPVIPLEKGFPWLAEVFGPVIPLEK